VSNTRLKIRRKQMITRTTQFQTPVVVEKGIQLTVLVNNKKVAEYTSTEKPMTFQGLVYFEMEGCLGVAMVEDLNNLPEFLREEKTNAES
jgi:hypothetical protein